MPHTTSESDSHVICIGTKLGTHRRYEVVALLGQFGADVNVRDNSGSTAYDIAIMIGEPLLVDVWPPLNPPPFTPTPMQETSR